MFLKFLKFILIFTFIIALFVSFSRISNTFKEVHNLGKYFKVTTLLHEQPKFTRCVNYLTLLFYYGLS